MGILVVKLKCDVVGLFLQLCELVWSIIHRHHFCFFLQRDLVCCGVLSGNRNFEGRIHPNTRANYLASPLLVIAYAIAGRVDIDFEKEPLGMFFEEFYLHNL